MASHFSIMGKYGRMSDMGTSRGETVSHEVLVLVSANPPHRFQGIARLAGERGWHIRT